MCSDITEAPEETAVTAVVWLSCLPGEVQRYFIFNLTSVSIGPFDFVHGCMAYKVF